MQIETTCIVQAGQVSAAAKEVLAARLGEITQSTFGADASIGWLEIAAGNGWTAGEPSTTSILSMTVPAMKQVDRTALLQAICQAWSEETRCHINEIVASAISAPASSGD